jgi:hypothetical protein
MADTFGSGLEFEVLFVSKIENLKRLKVLDLLHTGVKFNKILLVSVLKVS